MNLFTKSLITIFSTTILFQTLYAKDTTCYKRNWLKPSTIETVTLDGGECKGEFNFKQMKENGWKLKDLKIEKGEKGLNYVYIFTDKELISIDTVNFMKNKSSKLDYTTTTTTIKEILDDTIIIEKGNLRPGQSAVIEHEYENGQSMIVSSAYVIDSNETSSKLKLMPFLDIKQNAIPTANRSASVGDKVIINYLYNASLIIAPSKDAFTQTRTKYADINFLHSDMLGARLKIDEEPLPSKQTIQDFAMSQNLGTVFFIIGSKLYIVDSRTFTILDEETISYNFMENKMMPFYTRVEKIEKSVISSLLNISEWSTFIKDFLEDKRTEDEVLLEDEIQNETLQVKIEIYNNYYKTLLGLNK